MIVFRIAYNPNASTGALRHVRPGGIIVVHNAICGGKVLVAEPDGDIEAVRQATSTSRANRAGSRLTFPPETGW